MFFWLTFLAVGVNLAFGKDACCNGGLPPQKRLTSAPEGCNGTLYCPASDQLYYPSEQINRYIKINYDEFRKSYEDIVMYKSPPAQDDYPKNIRQIDPCDHIIDYPLITWAFTVPHGWLPIVQTPTFKQYFRLEFCESLHSNLLNNNNTSCQTSYNRYRVLAWVNKKIVSTRILLPDCCKCVFDHPQPVSRSLESVQYASKPVKVSYCEQCTLNDYDCLKQCVSRLPPSSTFRYCNECLQYDWNCLSTCYPHPLSKTVFCDHCPINDYVCLRTCQTRRRFSRPHTSVPCEQCAKEPNSWSCYARCDPKQRPARFCDDCSPWDLACLRHPACIPRQPRQAPYCSQCDRRDQHCKRICRPTPTCRLCDMDDGRSDYMWCLRWCEDTRTPAKGPVTSPTPQVTEVTKVAEVTEAPETKLPEPAHFVSTDAVTTDESPTTAKAMVDESSITEELTTVRPMVDETQSIISISLITDTTAAPFETTESATEDDQSTTDKVTTGHPETTESLDTDATPTSINVEETTIAPDTPTPVIGDAISTIEPLTNAQERDLETTTNSIDTTSRSSISTPAQQKSCECDPKVWRGWCVLEWFACLSEETKAVVWGKSQNY